MSRRQPPTRTRFPGLVVSISHSPGASSAFSAPVMVKVTCGFTQRSSTTLPLRVCVFEKSNIAAEWCAATCDTPAAIAARRANAANDFMTCRIVISCCSCRLFRRNGRGVAPFGLLHWNEDTVAFRVDALDQIAGGANAFDDVELACPLAEEDSRRLPRLGQDTRRDDFEVIVQDVFFGK